ncbi:unnamed protein product [Adineta ricciae]|uniref:Uncharacterized protein n=1 Tax=Adineta ricciae TaxID=249248 RepID=A0A815QD29_ADIRI|nr:unnamed protein product [Adineta ricciae]
MYCWYLCRLDSFINSGERKRVYTFPLTISFTIYYASNAWLNELVTGGGQPWYVANRVITNIRPDGFINTSPTAVTLPIIYKQINIQHVDVVQMSDVDATIPMSSVPLQFLFYGYPAPTGCSTPSQIIGNRPNRACIGTSVGSDVTEYVIVETYCPGQTIVNFITSTPIGIKEKVQFLIQVLYLSFNSQLEPTQYSIWS